MTKNTEDKKVNKEAEEAAAEAKINNPNRPTLPTNEGAADLETLSHNWQPGSPAVDLRFSGAENAVNLIEQERAAKEKAEEPKVKPITQAEYDRRIKLDVSHKDYINESLDYPVKG